MKKYFGLILLCLVSGFAVAQEYQTNISVHDPVMIREKDTYYLFCTGRGISVWSSKDLKSWKKEQQVFEQPPTWTTEAVKGFKGHFWAPDISYHEGTYYLYYSVSAFGKRTSAIGVATNTTLDAQDENYKWVDHGAVIRSFPDKTDWNAIDPNLIENKDGKPFLVFGSFWGGLQMTALDDSRLKPAKDSPKLINVASRKVNPSDSGANPIEAPFVFRKGDYFYLFASIDYCCQGANSTYKMIVGRSQEVEGPYLDAQGRDLARGGGTLVLAGDERWHGVGHNAVVSFDGQDYLVFHAYDATDKGIPRLRILPVSWDGNWPIVKN